MNPQGFDGLTQNRSGHAPFGKCPGYDKKMAKYKLASIR